jgi:hypothetical protein
VRSGSWLGLLCGLSAGRVAGLGKLLADVGVDKSFIAIKHIAIIVTQLMPLSDASAAL